MSNTTSRFLDWVVKQGDLNSKDDWVKIECMLLAKKLNYNFQVSDLTFTEEMYEVLASVYYPEYFLSSNFQSERLESEYVRYKAGLVSEKNYSDYNKETLLVPHYVFFDTDFGNNKKHNQEVTKKLVAWSKENFFNKPENGFHLFSQVDWIAQCGLALRCLNSDLDQSERNFLSYLDATEITWQTYHPHLVYELYKVT